VDPRRRRRRLRPRHPRHPPTEVDDKPLTGWTVTAPVSQRGSVAATSEWGSARADAIGLLQSAANQEAPTIDDYHDDGTRSVNNAETADAREKAAAIQSRFGLTLPIVTASRSTTASRGIVATAR
jgi:N12 class adenine-specific DNA methylase